MKWHLTVLQGKYKKGKKKTETISEDGAHECTGEGIGGDIEETDGRRTGVSGD